MHIQFTKIRYKNFLSVGESMAEWELNAQSFAVIIGTNGAGKSTLIDAILYALYGKPFRDIKLGQLINTFNKKKMLVEIEFEIGSNTYMVRRGQKPSVFEIFKNGEMLQEDSSRGSQQEILERDILQVKYRTFCQINVLGKATYEPFMKLKAQHRREVVEDLLDSRVYSVMAAHAKDDLKEVVANINSIETAISTNRSKIRYAQELIEKSNADVSDKIAAIDDQILNLQLEYPVIDMALQKCFESYKETEAALKAIDEVQLKQIGEYISQTQISNKSEIKRNEDIIKRIEHIDVCQTCSQPMDENHRRNVVKNSQEIIKKSQKELDELTPYITMYNEQSTNVRSLREELNDARQQGEQFSRDKKAIDNKIEFLTEQKQKLLQPAKVDFTEDVNSLQQEITKLEFDYDTEIAKQTELKDCIKFLADDGIKARLVNQYIPMINKHINEYLDEMDLFAQFTLDEEFNETIKSHYRDTYSYHSFSEGQKMRIDLAIMLTWREVAKSRNSTSTNLLIMDEITDGSMNDDGVRDFLNILKNSKISQNVFCISHKDTTIENFDVVYAAEMNGNYTEYTKR